MPHYAFFAFTRCEGKKTVMGHYYGTGAEVMVQGQKPVRNVAAGFEAVCFLIENDCG